MISFRLISVTDFRSGFGGLAVVLLVSSTLILFWRSSRWLDLAGHGPFGSHRKAVATRSRMMLFSGLLVFQPRLAVDGTKGADHRHSNSHVRAVFPTAMDLAGFVTPSDPPIVVTLHDGPLDAGLSPHGAHGVVTSVGRDHGHRSGLPGSCSRVTLFFSFLYCFSCSLLLVGGLPPQRGPDQECSLLVRPHLRRSRLF